MIYVFIAAAAILFIKKFKPSKKLKGMEGALIEKYAKDLGVQASWLDFIIKHESGYKTNAINKDTGAVGIIQFMPSTLRGLGYTTSQVQQMNFEQQLKLAAKYYKSLGVSKAKSLYDLYMLTFYPYAVGKPNNYILGSEVSQERAKLIGLQNPAINGGKPISVKDFKNYINSKK